MLITCWDAWISPHRRTGMLICLAFITPLMFKLAEKEMLVSIMVSDFYNKKSLVCTDRGKYQMRVHETRKKTSLILQFNVGTFPFAMP